MKKLILLTILLCALAALVPVAMADEPIVVEQVEQASTAAAGTSLREVDFEQWQKLDAAVFENRDNFIKWLTRVCDSRLNNYEMADIERAINNNRARSYDVLLSIDGGPFENANMRGMFQGELTEITITDSTTSGSLTIPVIFDDTPVSSEYRAATGLLVENYCGESMNGKTYELSICYRVNKIPIGQSQMKVSSLDPDEVFARLRQHMATIDESATPARQ